MQVQGQIWKAKQSQQKRTLAMLTYSASISNSSENCSATDRSVWSNCQLRKTNVKFCTYVQEKTAVRDATLMIEAYLLYQPENHPTLFPTISLNFLSLC